MLLHRTHLGVAPVASTEAFRPQLNGVHVMQRDGNTIATATDGHRMLRVTRPVSADDVENYPHPAASDVPAEGFTIPVKACADIAKAMPKKAHAHLANKAMVESVNGNVNVVATDLATTNRVTARPIDAVYPNVGQVIPKGEPVFRIAVSASYLAEMAGAIAKLHAQDGDKNASQVVLSFYSPLMPMRLDATLDGGSVLGLLMPLRLPDAKVTP